MESIPGLHPLTFTNSGSELYPVLPILRYFTLLLYPRLPQYSHRRHLRTNIKVVIIIQYSSLLITIHIKHLTNKVLSSHKAFQLSFVSSYRSMSVTLWKVISSHENSIFLSFPHIHPHQSPHEKLYPVTKTPYSFHFPISIHISHLPYDQLYSIMKTPSSSRFPHIHLYISHLMTSHIQSWKPFFLLNHRIHPHQSPYMTSYIQSWKLHLSLKSSYINPYQSPYDQHLHLYVIEDTLGLLELFSFKLSFYKYPFTSNILEPELYSVISILLPRFVSVLLFVPLTLALLNLPKGKV